MSEYQHEVTKCDFRFLNWKLLRLSRNIDLYFEKLFFIPQDTVGTHLKQEMFLNDNSSILSVSSFISTLNIPLVYW